MQHSIHYCIMIRSSRSHKQLHPLEFFGGFDIKGTAALRDDRRVELKVSLPTSKPSSRDVSCTERSRDMTGEFATVASHGGIGVAGRDTDGNGSLTIPVDYLRSGNADILEDEERSGDGGTVVSRFVRSVTLHQYEAANIVKSAAPCDSSSSTLQYGNMESEHSSIADAAANHSTHSIHTDHGGRDVKEESYGSVSPLHLNPPRVGKGPYATPALHDLYQEVEDTIEEAPLASHNFLPNKLEPPHLSHSGHHGSSCGTSARPPLVFQGVSQSEVNDSDDDSHHSEHRPVGVYMRGEVEASDNDVFDIRKGLATLGGDDRPVVIRASTAGEEKRRPDPIKDSAVLDAGGNTLTNSVQTRQLIGRSTWDRVVGMHSSTAKDFIASQLKDPRIVFIINTAGPIRRPMSSTPTTPSTARVAEIGAIFEDLDDLRFSGDDDNVVMFATVNDVSAPIAPDVAEDISEAYDSFPIAATPPLSAPRPQLPGGLLRPPQSPKPSFTRRHH